MEQACLIWLAVCRRSDWPVVQECDARLHKVKRVHFSHMIMSLVPIKLSPIMDSKSITSVSALRHQAEKSPYGRLRMVTGAC